MTHLFKLNPNGLYWSKHYVKSVRIRSYSGSYFPAFVLNTKRYSVSFRIQSECGKMRTRITANKDTFYAVKSFYNNKKFPLVSSFIDETILTILSFIDNKFVTDIKTKINIFSKSFVEQCTPLNESVLPTSQHVLTQSRLHSINFRFEEISKILRSLDVNKAHGRDNIFKE